MKKNTKIAVGVGLAAVAVGLGIYFYKRGKDKTPPATTGLGYMPQRFGLGLIDASRVPERLGSLYLPRNGSMPRDTRVGLITAQQRYKPRHGVHIGPY